MKLVESSESEEDDKEFLMKDVLKLVKSSEEYAESCEGKTLTF